MEKKSTKTMKDLAVKNANALKGGLAMRKAGGDPSIIAI